MDWVGIWNTEDGTRGWRFTGKTVSGTLDGGACRAVFGEVEPDRILVAGAESAPPDAIPAALMPDQLLTGAGALVLPGLEQRQPRHRIGGARLTALGFLALNEGWDGVICVPGSVTHWIGVSAGEAVFLQSALSLRLAAAVGLAVAAPDPEAVSEGLSRPERLSSALRSAVLTGSDPVATGWLIGTELAATKPLWLGQQVAVLGEGTGAAAYRAALEAQGLPVTLAPAAAMAEKGMAALGARFGLTG